VICWKLMAKAPRIPAMIHGRNLGTLWTRTACSMPGLPVTPALSLITCRG